MTEREMEDLLWQHPEKLLNEPLKQFRRQPRVHGIGRADLVFEDRLGRLLVVELKNGKLQRGAIGQLHDYFGMMKHQFPQRPVELMVVANIIPVERRLACEQYNIECREISEKRFRDVADEMGYVIQSEANAPAAPGTDNEPEPARAPVANRHREHAAADVPRERSSADWLLSYLELTEINEAPEAFHLWTGVGCLSAALRRRVWLPEGLGAIYPNLYIVLVGPPGTKKSSALEIGIDILKAAGQPLPMLAEVGTPQAIINSLEPLPSGPKDRKEGHGLIYASELSEFLGPNAARSGIFPFLTELYDCKGSVTRGKQEVHNAYIVMLTASTPDLLQRIIPLNAVKDGFGSRLIIVPGSPERCIPQPEITEEHVQIRKELIQDLRLVSMIEGKFSMDKAALDWFKEWYIEDRHVALASDLMTGWASTKGTTLKKLGMILSVNTRNNLVVTKDDLETALEMLDEIEPQREELLPSAAQTKTGKHIAFVRSVLMAEGGCITRSALLRRMSHKLKGKELGKVLADMAKAGIVEMGPVKKWPRGGKRATEIRLKTHRSLDDDC